MENGERYHMPGSMYWLRPETYVNLLVVIYESMWRRGFRAIVVLAGHWAEDTLPAIAASGAELLRLHPDIRWMMVSDLELGADLGYLHEHAAAGETSILMALRSELVRLDLIYETGKTLAGEYAGEPEHLLHRGATPNKYIAY